MLNESLCSVIVAGGTGSRMELTKPKPLLVFEGKSLLQYNIDSQIKAGIKNIFILINDIYFKYEFNNIIKGYTSVNLQICSNYSSTFLLLYNNLPSFSKILFNYGHAPRPTSHLLKLIAIDADIVASCYKNSTMRNNIPISHNRFIEPPYIINTDIIKKSKSDSWSSFFKVNNQFVKIYIDAPQEFNYYNEYYEYLHYLNDLSSSEF